MKPKHVALALLVSFILGIALATGYARYHENFLSAQESVKQEKSRAATPVNPLQVKLPEASPQLALIRTSPAVVSEVPLAKPLAARLSYDENHTTRITSPIAGRLADLVAKPGDPVRRGQALAYIDSPDFSQAVSDVEKARADDERKDLNLRRSKAMFEAGLLAKRDLESAEADFRQAQAESRRASARLSNLNATGIRARRFALASPLAGFVVDRQANPGMEVRPDLPNPLFVVSNLKTLWALLDVPEQSLRAVSIGSGVTLEVSGFPGREFRGAVDFISPVLDPATRRIQARVTMDNADGLLRPEMYAKAVVSGKEGRKAIRIPISALVTAGERSYVFVEMGSATFEKRPVELTAQNRDYAYASKGLEVGDRVVTAGALLLASEAAIRQ